MLNRLTIATALALLTGLFAVGTATAAPPDRPATPPPTDYWQDLGFLNMAHQGGELEAPGNTLYAFKTAMQYRGADTLEMDGYVSSDGVFMVTHDMRPAGTSDAPNDSDHEIRDLTLAELKTYDFGYKFSPGKGHYSYNAADPHPFRGIATGAVEPPTGYSANDFRMATFEEVLAAFPDTPINIDMKSYTPDPSVTLAAADALAAIMNAHPERSEDVIVASFSQASMERFHQMAPDHKALSGSLDATLSYVQGNALTPTPVAVQPPDIFNLPPVLRTVPVLKEKADYDGFAVHVWGSDIDPEQESDAFYAKLIGEGADGFFTQVPSELHQYLCEAGIARPDGSPRCAQQVCPEGQTGIAPDNCVDIPPTTCPEGQVGTPPDCTDVQPVVGPLKMVARPTVQGKKMRVNLLCSANYDSCDTATVVVRAKGKVRGFKKPLLARRSGIKVDPGKTKRVYMNLTGKARNIFRDKKFRKNGKKRTRKGALKVRANIQINGENFGVRTVLRIGRVR